METIYVKSEPVCGDQLDDQDFPNKVKVCFKFHHVESQEIGPRCRMYF